MYQWSAGRVFSSRALSLLRKMAPPHISKSILKYRFLSLAPLKCNNQGARAPSVPRPARHCYVCRVIPFIKRNAMLGDILC